MLRVVQNYQKLSHPGQAIRNGAFLPGLNHQIIMLIKDFFWGGVVSGAETGITLYANARGDAYDSIIAIYFLEGGGGVARSWTTTSFYQDSTAWTHLLVRYDSTDVTADDRIQIWVNGTRISDWSSQDGGNPDLNETCDVFADQNLAVGRECDSGDRFSFNGYLAEVCVLDGTAADATDFGEFDETNATVWKPKKVSGLAFGTNGFYLDFQDSANLGNDANGGARSHRVQHRRGGPDDGHPHE